MPLSGTEREHDAVHRILLVDEQAHVLRIMRSTLARSGYEVDTAAQGQQALQRFDERRFDVVITELSMQAMDGRRLCESIARRCSSDPPLMLVMADVVPHAGADWMARLPTTERVDKPVSLRWLVARLSQHFGHFGDGVNERCRSG